jgi:hypothetical protein
MKSSQKEAMRQKVLERWERAQESLKWYEHRTTWTPSPEEVKAAEEYQAANPSLPF